MEKIFYTFDDLLRWNSFADSFDPPARFAVIGDPIGHSKSPLMHNPALIARGVSAQYIRVQIPIGYVRNALHLFSQYGFLGVNCTIPHKFEALSAMDESDELALKLGAVNTVSILKGKLMGYNTDGPGFIHSVAESFGKHIRDLRVLVIGAGGGAGRAVAMQCAIEKCPRLILVNRTLEKIRELETSCRSASPSTSVLLSEWTEENINTLLNQVDLVVNATPLGMRHSDPGLFDFRLLTDRHLVYDMVYLSTGETPLIEAAKKAGAMTCDGLTLLLHQGALSFEHWLGGPVPLDVMQKSLLIKD